MPPTRRGTSTRRAGKKYLGVDRGYAVFAKPMQRVESASSQPWKRFVWHSPRFQTWVRPPRRLDGPRQTGRDSRNGLRAGNGKWDLARCGNGADTVGFHRKMPTGQGAAAA